MVPCPSEPRQSSSQCAPCLLSNLHVFALAFLPAGVSSLPLPLSVWRAPLPLGSAAAPSSPTGVWRQLEPACQSQLTSLPNSPAVVAPRNLEPAPGGNIYTVEIGPPEQGGCSPPPAPYVLLGPWLPCEILRSWCCVISISGRAQNLADSGAW